ncbi:MAG: type IV toxin-antitoxin system AbiEi family antitoxin domain-containing protein [Anaerolineae bacterium]
MAEEPGTIQLSHLEQTIYFASQRQGVHLLDADFATDLVDISRRHAVNLLASMAQKGALHRVGRGRYAVIPPDVLYGRRSYVVDPHLILDELMQSNGADGRYYVAYQSAAAIHGAVHQLPFVLLVAVPKQRRPIELGRARIQFVQLKPEKFFGFQQTTYHDFPLNISDREKTILDCLERFDLCGGVAEVARTISTLIGEADPATLLDYLQRMDNQALAQRLGLILERLSTVQEIEGDLIADIARQVSQHVYPLDPHEPEAGVLDSRWRIRENVDVLGEL